MQFARHLRDAVRAGEITCSVRIWQNARVKTGGSYRMDEGRVIIDSIREITVDQVTDTLARRSGFADTTALLETARHGSGENVYLVEFHYLGSDA